jgi:3-hydroxyisobutyrate dehydrogenase
MSGPARAETIAVLGAGGTMGRPMARNIARAGIEVRAWNRSAEKLAPLADEERITIAATAAQAVEDAGVIVTMLSDSDAVIATVDGADGALAHCASSTVWAQMGTIGVSGTEHCAELAERYGVAFVDAPVLGTKQPAEQGKLVVLASGPDEQRDRLLPLFDAVGTKLLWLGPAGIGSRLKLVANTWLVAIVEGIAETIALTEAAGVDPGSFLDALAGGPLDQPYMRLKAKAIIDRDFEPSFSLAMAAKDATLARELAEQLELDLPLLAAVAQRMTEAAVEHGNEDLAATYWASAAQAGRLR